MHFMCTQEHNLRGSPFLFPPLAGRYVTVLETCRFAGVGTRRRHFPDSLWCGRTYKASRPSDMSPHLSDMSMHPQQLVSGLSQC